MALEHVQGVYVDNVPCSTPPFAVFIERCLSLQPWQQNDKWQKCENAKVVPETKPHKAFAAENQF